MEVSISWYSNLKDEKVGKRILKAIFKKSQCYSLTHDSYTSLNNNKKKSPFFSPKKENNNNYRYLPFRCYFVGGCSYAVGRDDLKAKEYLNP